MAREIGRGSSTIAVAPYAQVKDEEGLASGDDVDAECVQCVRVR